MLLLGERHVEVFGALLLRCVIHASHVGRLGYLLGVGVLVHRQGVLGLMRMMIGRGCTAANTKLMVLQSLITAYFADFLGGIQAFGGMRTAVSTKALTILASSLLNSFSALVLLLGCLVQVPHLLVLFER